MESYAESRLTLTGPHTRDDFLHLYRKCKDKRLAERYLALSFGFEFRWKKVAEMLGLDYQTVLEWARAYNEHGLEGLDPDRQQGRPSSLTGEQKDQMKETVKQSPRTQGFRFSNWTVQRIAGWIAERFHIALSAERVRQILHRIGFSYVKPTYRYLQAEGLEKAQFACDLRMCRENQEALVFEDESSVDSHPGTHGMWVLKGTKPKVPTFGTHVKRHVFAAVNPATGTVVSKVSKRLTAKAFVGFVHALLKQISTSFTLVMDSSPCHTARAARQFLEKHRDRIRILWLPRYSPDLNPTEQLWRGMKFSVTHNWFFGTVNRLAWAIRGYFRNLAPEKVRSLCSTDYLFG